MAEFIKQYWLETLFGLLLALLGAGYRSLSSRFKRKLKEQDAVKEGILAILHDRLYSECEALILKGDCDVEAMKNVEYLYNSYHALGGNGTGTELFERVKHLKLQ